MAAVRQFLDMIVKGCTGQWVIPLTNRSEIEKPPDPLFINLSVPSFIWRSKMRKSNWKIFITVLFLAIVLCLGAYASNIGGEKTKKSLPPGSQGASCCTNGYEPSGTYSNLRGDEIRRLREERSLFLQKIKKLRQSYDEKAIKLNDELSKKNPNAEITARIHGDISDLRAQLAKEHNTYLNKIKKINPNLLQGSCSTTSKRSSVGAGCCSQ